MGTRRAHRSAFFVGFARALDLAGVIHSDNITKAKNRSAGFRGDREALASDWNAIGNDLWSVLGQMERRTDKP